MIVSNVGRLIPESNSARSRITNAMRRVHSRFRWWHPSPFLQTVPTPPHAVEVSITGLVSFLPPTDDGGTPILGYTVEVVCISCGRLYGDASNTKVSGTASPIQAVLNAGEKYEIYITAQNAVGSSSPSLGTFGAIFAEAVVSLQAVLPSPVPCYLTVRELPVDSRLYRALLGTHAPPFQQAAPGTPQNLAVTPAGLVTYEPPNDDGGALITSYTITVRQGGTLIDTFTAVEPDLLSHQLSSLTPGQKYTVSVVANNAAGLKSALPATKTYTPPVILVSMRGVSWLGWVAPEPASATFMQLGGLGKGCWTKDAIRASARASLGPFSRCWRPCPQKTRRAPTCLPTLPQTAPSPPRSVEVSASGIVSFLAPANDGGTPILGYTVEVVCTSDGQKHGDAGNTKVTHEHSPIQTALDPGKTYEIYVTARNAVGSSLPAAPALTTTAPVCIAKQDEQDVQADALVVGERVPLSLALWVSGMESQHAHRLRKSHQLP